MKANYNRVSLISPGPADRERFESAVSLLSSFGFSCIDFSTERSDVLFINDNLIDVPRLAKSLLMLKSIVPE